jgi:PHD/YefM family antitoxin component YafN of YafNO toxin-antitoxin module
MEVWERYITDSEGNRLGVLLSLEEYQYLLDELEELNDIRAYDAAKQSDDEVISFEQATTEIESQRQ